MPLTRQHQRALVTSGSRGIGAAMVKRLEKAPMVCADLWSASPTKPTKRCRRRRTKLCI
jgi:hypothetical protein